MNALDEHEEMCDSAQGTRCRSICALYRRNYVDLNFYYNMGPFVVHHYYVISCDGAKVPSWGSDF